MMCMCMCVGIRVCDCGHSVRSEVQGQPWVSVPCLLPCLRWLLLLFAAVGTELAGLFSQQVSHAHLPSCHRRERWGFRHVNPRVGGLYMGSWKSHSVPHVYETCFANRAISPGPKGQVLKTNEVTGSWSIRRYQGPWAG